MPSLVDYIGFAFFPPTLLMGPINLLENHLNFLDSKLELRLSLFFEAIYRIIVGLFKFLVVGPVFENLGVAGFIGDGFSHSPLEFIVAVFSSFLYLYMNFSGFCDIVIAVCALFNLKIRENFYFPFKARNIGDFWNRWHISMSHFMRDTFFTPLSVQAARKFSRIQTKHSVALVSFLTFFLIGIWHGTTKNFVILGLLHGIGALIYQYYAAAIRKKGRKFVDRYNSNKKIEYAMIGLTVTYVSFVSLLFIDSIEQIYKYFEAIKL